MLKESGSRETAASEMETGIIETALQSASIWRMFSLPVGCVMVEVPILMTMRIQASLLPYLAVWKYSILRVA